jgi:DNA polymerase III subunit epsilon
VIFCWLTRPSRNIHPLVDKFDSAALPDSRSTIKDCPLLAIDLETTGLNARKDHIVSVGWVPVRAREIIISEARHYLVQSPVSVGQSAVIHGLLDRDLKDARRLEDVLVELLETYAGYIFVAHHATLDKLFLQVAMRHSFGQAPKFHFIDTMEVERQWLQQREIAVKDSSLSLTACLQRHQLPDGLLTHDALEDAYGCALLLLSQACRTKATLGSLTRRSRL